VENYRFLGISGLLLIVGFIVPTRSFAYERHTHQGITEATIRAYESLKGDAFTDSEEQIIRGSSNEDDGTRPLNHFYDPISGRGLTVGFFLPPSEEWAKDTEAQGNYCDFGICQKRIGYEDKLFSSPTDFSWNRGIYDYVYGDKKRGLETLGHVLHLVQDATVPAHVRNDQHLNHEGFGDPDPYEQFTSQFSLGNIPSPSRIDIPKYSDLGTYFYRTALFTNNNFVSKDSLFTKFELPNLDNVEIKGDYLVHPLYGHKVARVKYNLDRAGNKKDFEIFADDSEGSVTADYWKLLSEKAISMGVGVTDLFFKEVEKEKQLAILKSKNLSHSEIETRKLAYTGFALAKGLYGSSLAQKDVGDLLKISPQKQSAAVIETVHFREWADNLERKAALKAKSNTGENTQGNPVPIQREARKEEKAAEASKLEQAGEVLGVSTSEESVPQLTIDAPPPPSPYMPGFGGGGSPQVEEESEASVAPTITSPSAGASLSTSTVTFVGTTGAGYLVTGVVGATTGTTTANGTGNWQITFVLGEGTSTASFTVEDADGLESSATERSVTIDLTAPGTPVAALGECSYSLSSSFCLLGGTSGTLSWGSVTGASSYSIFSNSSFSSSVTGTSTTVTLTDQATTTLEVVAYDAAGNVATSSSVAVRVFAQPLVINEVGWAGTKTSSDDQWLELKNRTAYSVDLSRLALYTADAETYIPLSGSIPGASSLDATDIYLIERASNVTSATGNLTTSFTALSLSGEKIFLGHGHGTATTTLDQTPDITTCSGWCAGANASSTGFSATHGTFTNSISMERTNISASGTLSSSWRDNDTYQELTGLTDASGYWLFGSPGRENSVGYPQVGWFCNSDEVSITSGSTYAPTSGNCTYLSAFTRYQSLVVNRMGVLYRGEVGSSTEVTSHSLGNNDILSAESGNAISSPVAGESFFIAIWEARQSSSDTTSFSSYFKTGSPTPPHSSYRVIQWTYGP